MKRRTPGLWLASRVSPTIPYGHPATRYSWHLGIGVPRYPWVIGDRGKLMPLLLALIRSPQSISYCRSHWYVHAYPLPRVLEFSLGSPLFVALPYAHDTHDTRHVLRHCPFSRNRVYYDRDRSTGGDVSSARTTLFPGEWGRLPSRSLNGWTPSPHMKGVTARGLY